MAQTPKDEHRHDDPKGRPPTPAEQRDRDEAERKEEDHERQSANDPNRPTAAQIGDPAIEKERASEARRIFDGYEDDDGPVTAQTDQLRRSIDMERVGPTAWMVELERRIRERQGDPPAEPRQVHGVAPAPRPR